MRDIVKQVSFGKYWENKCKEQLNELNTFGQLNLTDSYNDFENFDMFNDNYYIEHKQRKIKGKQYPTLVFDYVKWRRFLELKKDKPSLRFFVIWTCTDDRYIWEMKEPMWGTEVYVNRWEQQDRGKGYLQDTDVCNVPVEYIKKFKDFNLESV